MSKVSIVSPYFDRKPQLYRTLKSIQPSSIKDIEYIIVDDASSPQHRVEDLAKEFNFLRVIRVDPKDKFYLNPCIPYNMGIAEAKGDFVILQSPECIHMGDVVAYVVDNIEQNQYFVFSCYSLNNRDTDKLGCIDFNSNYDSLISNITAGLGGFTDKSCESSAGRYSTWFAHSVYRPCMFNFMVALTKQDLDSLGGFNEAFYDGHSYDDTEFASRVLKKRMEITYIDKPFCIHQYHDPVLNNIPNFSNRLEKNKRIYEQSLQSTEYYTKNSFIK